MNFDVSNAVMSCCWAKGLRARHHSMASSKLTLNPANLCKYMSMSTARSSVGVMFPIMLYLLLSFLSPILREDFESAKLGQVLHGRQRDLGGMDS